MCIVSKPSVRFLSPKLATLLSTVDQVNLTNGLFHNVTVRPNIHR